MALAQILKINQRIDKIAAMQVDFKSCGMLMNSCLVQAIKDAFSNMSPSDEDTSDPKTDTETSDNEIQTHLTGAQETHGGPSNTNKEIIDETDINLPHTPPHSSPQPPTDDEDDDCGPVESGPLMNEVHLMGRKGKGSLFMRWHLNLPICRIHQGIPHFA